MNPRPYTVDRDMDGVRIALGELLEESFQRGRIVQAAEHKNTPALRDRYFAEQMEAGTRKRTLASGYYSFCMHLFRLDTEREAGLPLDIATLAAFEGEGLRTLAAARAAHRAKHPPCSRCGLEQETRFHPKCTGCGVQFGGKSK